MFASLKANFTMYLFYLVGGIGFFMVIEFTTTGQEAMKTMGVEGILIGLSLALGFLITSVFVAFGLVKIPIHLWKRSDLERRYNRSLIKLATLCNKTERA
mmetsp:Transcript_37874/g.51451  ORF Transcript_37874/g.51451 Transcript_37874/m.51451 type:complete len:100 (+) Transcript_37874:344-643(+)